jgi:hypothetical protein
MTSDETIIDFPAVTADTDRFYSNLSHAMHAAAQALTVLQLSYNAKRIPSMKRGALIECALSATQEIDRLCVSLGYVQEFIAIQTCTPRVGSVELLHLVADVLGGVELLFQNAGIFLVSRTPAVCDRVLINATKVSQALGAVLLIAYGIAKKNDTVQVAVTTFPEAIEVEVRTIGVNVESIDADASLRIAIAEANIRCQTGMMSYALEPFCVKIVLRKAVRSDQLSF